MGTATDADGTGPGLAAPGTMEAFDDFAERERPALAAFAWSLTGDLATAEELTQDALVAAWHAWDRVGGYDKPGAWARRVVANKASSHRRRVGRESRAVLRLRWRRASDASDASDVSEAGRLGIPDADAELWKAVRALPERQAQVVALHYLEDRSVAEIAEILGCAEGTVKAHLHKARRALARSLGLLAAADEPEQEDDR